ncbi:MAG: hypothetical protein U5L72_14650 [Bacteroidales bacterium]|nr:hypothetical protein [Bacteroidales bacterium]
MEDGGLGGLIFYIILGIIALAGSFKGKGKKPQAPPKKVLQRMPDEEEMTPPVRTAPARTVPTPAPRQQRRPQFMPMEPSMEGKYEDQLAKRFSREGSAAATMAEAFAMEGSIEDSMASAFASEGASAFKDFQTSDFVHTEISETEIGDAPEYDYNVRPGSEILSGGFDLKKAVIYSALLNRAEYSA